MATLVSPGVSVSIVDESLYASAGAGTVPLIIMATAANKTAPSGTGYAPYTTAANAGKLFLATSQLELVQNFGTPNFVSVQGTQIHGHELNEYGLHAAYTYLGISNRAYVIRADIDLAQLEASETMPRGLPLAGQYWLDLGSTTWGVFRSNGSKNAGLAWDAQQVLVAVNANVAPNADGQDIPLDSFGANGDYAVVVTQADNRLYEKVSNSWYEVGTSAWKAARPTTVTGTANPATVVTGAQFIINGTAITVTDGSVPGVVQAINAVAIPNIVASTVNFALQIKNTAGGPINIQDLNLTPLSTLGLVAGTYAGPQVLRTSDAQYPANSNQGDVWVKGTVSNNGANWVVKIYSADTGAYSLLTTPLYAFNSLLPDTSVLAKDGAALQYLGTIAGNTVQGPAAGTIYVGYDAATGVQMLRRWNGNYFEPLAYIAAYEAPTEDPDEGTLWYNADFKTDIMVGDGRQWLGYRVMYPETDPQGVILSGSTPLFQTDGSPLVQNDLWIDTTDTENYPSLYRYDASVLRWKKVVTSDQTTPFGIAFWDARQDSGTNKDADGNSIGAWVENSTEMKDLLVSNFVDPDAPDARTYPAGMLLFNTRYSTYNVKVWYPHYFEAGQFDPNTDFRYTSYNVGGSADFPMLPNGQQGRWVTESGHQLDGTPYMGRKAQRAVIVKAMAATINADDDLRSELINFNLMAAPGYPELIDEMQGLNLEQKQVSFVVADTPIRLTPQASALQAWAQNTGGYPNGEKGLKQGDVYTGVYYPWGLGDNLDGSEIMIPPSTIALCTMAYNDQVAYPWFAPAGFQRGLVTCATTVGYLTSEGEFKSVLLNQGQRDTLYQNNINPIAFIPGRGLVVYGQKTLSSVASALDRINVARLANYLKFNLDNILKPFLFEQNDQQTRDSAKLTVQRFLSGLITLRALEDFAVLCDTTNNTPERRDRNELWVDILIKPIKAIEFIYVPVRIRNSSDSLQFATPNTSSIANA